MEDREQYGVTIYQKFIFLIREIRLDYRFGGSVERS